MSRCVERARQRGSFVHRDVRRFRRSAPQLSRAGHGCHPRVTIVTRPSRLPSRQPFHVTFPSHSRGNVTLNGRERRSRRSRAAPGAPALRARHLHVTNLARASRLPARPPAHRPPLRDRRHSRHGDKKHDFLGRPALGVFATIDCPNPQHRREVPANHVIEASGEGGIRTLERGQPPLRDFQSRPFNRSGTSP